MFGLICQISHDAIPWRRDCYLPYVRTATIFITRNANAVLDVFRPSVCCWSLHFNFLYFQNCLKKQKWIFTAVKPGFILLNTRITDVMTIFFPLRSLKIPFRCVMLYSFFKEKKIEYNGGLLTND